MLTIEQLIACGVRPTQAKAFAPFMPAVCSRFAIVTLMQRAAFVAQCMWESEAFTHLEEDLYYTKPERIVQMFKSRVPSLADAARLTRQPQALANVAGANKNGNGDAASGDGWRYRGRGPLQLTGRTNYAKAGLAARLPFLEKPEMVSLPEHGLSAAAWYWQDAGCNESMANGLFDETTRKINGPAMAGAKERKALYASCMEALR